MLADESTENGKQLSQLYHQGFGDCIAEMLRFLAGVEGVAVSDALKSRLVNHLKLYFGDFGNGSIPLQHRKANHPAHPLVKQSELKMSNDHLLNFSQPDLLPVNPLVKSEASDDPSSSITANSAFKKASPTQPSDQLGKSKYQSANERSVPQSVILTNGTISKTKQEWQRTKRSQSVDLEPLDMSVKRSRQAASISSKSVKDGAFDNSNEPMPNRSSTSQLREILQSRISNASNVQAKHTSLKQALEANPSQQHASQNNSTNTNFWGCRDLNKVGSFIAAPSTGPVRGQPGAAIYLSALSYPPKPLPPNYDPKLEALPQSQIAAQGCNPLEHQTALSRSASLQSEIIRRSNSVGHQLHDYSTSGRRKLSQQLSTIGSMASVMGPADQKSSNCSVIAFTSSGIAEKEAYRARGEPVLAGGFSSKNSAFHAPCDTKSKHQPHVASHITALLADGHSDAGSTGSKATGSVSSHCYPHSPSSSGSGKRSLQLGSSAGFSSGSDEEFYASNSPPTAADQKHAATGRLQPPTGANPPRALLAALTTNSGDSDKIRPPSGVKVPIFALHASKMFYVPLTVDASTLILSSTPLSRTFLQTSSPSSPSSLHAGQIQRRLWTALTSELPVDETAKISTSSLLHHVSIPVHFSFLDQFTVTGEQSVSNTVNITLSRKSSTNTSDLISTGSSHSSDSELQTATRRPSNDLPNLAETENRPEYEIRNA